ncbi:dual specificity protein phosphatase, putative [Entamoeba invadens IP1]|uniref:protein-tyrosine-phosphatase n=1 Tax=Entamoeba invadens IP1 TaxID=370355 RepID=A0A0A1U4U3_ENTIV|nr:dual specificity protein phosphatase, putative [Entamoeba invadens IP1]ELP89292.1 dual specificity protein phosphatase, putative [Entamoeba invadens IP1]|eukprot:XP_004256063.1 dual specificity protein phosphatase, putative [Entamoeba invadens IP1]
MGNDNSMKLTQKNRDEVLQHINTVTEILPNIYLSSRHAAEDPNTYKLNGITAVLSLTTNLTKYPQNIKTKHFHVQDSFFFLLDQVLTESLCWLIEMVNSGHKVLVHCEVGVSRSASVVLAYLMMVNHWTLKQSFLFCKAKRSVVCPNPGFIIQLYQFQIKMGIKDTTENSLFVKGLLTQSNTLYREVPVRALWNSFLENGFSYEKAIKDHCRVAASASRSA